MKTLNRTLSILLAGLLLGFMIIINLHLPTDTQASPLAGFTPTPVPPPPDGGNGGGDDGGDDSSHNDNNDNDDNGNDDGSPAPDNTVVIQIDLCDLSCNIQAQQDTEASTSQNLSLIPTNTDTLTPMSSELHVPVQLIHSETGWIAEGVLSNQQATHFALPYPGQWEVYQTALPTIITTNSSEQHPLTIALANSFNGTSELLGQVEANVTVTQFVRCPLNCVAEPPAVAAPPAGDMPPHLPETGGEHFQNLEVLLVTFFAGISLILVGWAIRRTIK